MTPLFSSQSAQAFARDWIAAWNSRDLEKILKHYAPGIEFSSPFVGRLMGPNLNTVRGLAVLRLYFRRALNAYPDLCFTFQRVYAGAESLVVEYKSIEGRLASEMMMFNEGGLVCRVYAHYWSEA